MSAICGSSCHRITQACPYPLSTQVKVLAHPEIQQASLECKVVAGVVAEPIAADTFGRVERQGTRSISDEVANLGAPRHGGYFFRHLQQQLLSALEVVGE